MNAERLLQHYERSADAPDAIARLRRFILDLAVRGKLVPQDANDEPAKVLHAQLAKRFAEHSSGKGRGRRSEIAAGLVDQPPYASPAGWLWVRMGELGETNIGLTYSPNDLRADGIPVLRSNNVQEGKIVLDDLVRVISEPKPSVIVHQGDMLICARNGSRALVGKAALIDCLPEPMAFGAFMAIFRSPINPYLHMFLASPVFRQVIDEVNTNTINQITQANLRSTLVPLPPLEEQHRIIAKVDELMDLCDRLEAARAGREAVRDRLAAAGLARLNEPDPETFQADARFALDVLPALTTRPDQIKRLRQSILNLAVRGKLVPQDQNDEPALDLPARLASMRRNAKGTRDDGGRDFHRADWPFTLPHFWTWSSFGMLTIRSGVGLDRGKAQQGADCHHGYFKMNNIGNSGGYDLHNLARIDASEDEVMQFALMDGDFLFNTRNSRELVGKTCVFREPVGGPILYNNNILRVRFSSDIVPEWIDFWMRSTIGQAELDLLKSNTTNVCAIYQGKLASCACPVPPLAEQRRIVAKVDELMGLCDQLEASLAATAATRRRLLDALLAEALTPVDAREMEAAE
jgi:type I restriction enzyme, S subunit